MDEIEIKIWQDHNPLEIIIEKQYYHIVNVFMVFLYLLYFILLCFSIREVDYTNKSIFFLSDVSRQNLYGYVIVTKTGRAGTTSNVTIRLIGKTAESDAHVLNYPDPLLKILQKGEEDWFFLATKVHLGKILEIELWYDGIGGLPYWYCKSVNIFDVQNDQWYEFRISSLFTIHPKPKIYAREKALDSIRGPSIRVKLLKLLDNLRPDYRIFSLSLRRIDEYRSYVKRLTIMFSIVLAIGFWSIILNGVPHGAPIDSIMRFCEYKLNIFTTSYGIVGSIAAAITHLPIVHIFTVSRLRFSENGSPYRENQPFIVTILCWSVIIILITFNSTFIILCGVWIPTVDAYLWITSVAIGLIFYILVIETISGTLMRFIRGNYDEYEVYVKQKLRRIMIDIEKQRDILYRLLGKYLLRPFLQHLYKPMETSKIKYRLIVEKMKFEVRELIENMVMFVIYTSLMYMVILTNKDHYSVNSNKQISSLMDGSYTKTYSLGDVTTISNLEEYIANTLIVATQSRTWYGKYAVRDPGMTNDYSNKMLGVIRIRQHRSEANSCGVPDIMRFTNRSCNGDYFKSQSFRDYGIRWSLSEPSSSEGRMANVWKFLNSSETGTFPFIGKLGIYTGGGYVAFLGRGMKNSYVNFNYLQHYSWFDVLTRGIFIEFLLYNTNSNVFNSVQFTIEKSVTGYLKIEVKVDTSKMLLVNEKKFTAINTLLGIFVVIVLFLSMKTLMRILRTGVWYFKDVWHLIDIVLISLSYTCIVLYYKRSTKVGALLESLEGVEPRDFVNYFALYRVDHAFTITAALLITVATIKLWLLFRFLLVFKVAERTFSAMFRSLCALFCYHVVSLFAFSFFAYILFVDHLYRFAGMVNTVEFLSELNIRSFSEEERTVLNTPYMGLGYIFYILYSFTVMISNCIYTSMIAIFYSKAKEELSEYHGSYSVKNYLKTQFQFYYNLAKVRLKYLRMKAGGTVGGNYTPVEPKADEHRFADCFTLGIDKLRAMSLVSLCVLKNSNPKRKPLSQRDIRLMTYTLYYLKKIDNNPDDEEEVERFYKADLGGNKVKLIPEFNLTKIEAAASILLGQSQDKTMKDLNINGDDIIRDDIKQGIQHLKNELSLMLETLNKVKIITL
ncbi:hypothetical protein WA026_022561 [Henosepilachna vigintioctopunctata]|uniref:PLAT domain-containing protein n=1 Tax=Henosepilachna vigintioctopunctata TaxID=420089 RepID=A0AAW1VHH0_9CUCU